MKEKVEGLTVEPFIQISDSLLSIQAWVEGNKSLVAGFTTKQNGFSQGSFQSLNMAFHVNDQQEDVISNRKSVASEIKIPVENWTGAEQTHDSGIIKVMGQHKGHGAVDYGSALRVTDGLYTNQTGQLLTLCFADCVPLFFLAPKQRLIGIAHAGWKGTVAGIGARMVEEWRTQEGVEMDDIQVVIGPSICQNCYTVDKKVINLLEVILEDETKTAYNQITESQFQLDLKLANSLILQKAGILPKNILTTAFCTSCDHSLFFSHRRDRGKTGRMMSFIGWKED